MYSHLTYTDRHINLRPYEMTCMLAAMTCVAMNSSNKGYDGPLVLQDEEDMCTNTDCLLISSNAITGASIHHLPLILRKDSGADTQEALDCPLLRSEKQFAQTNIVASAVSLKSVDT